MAIEDVEKRLQAFTTALDAAGIEYAIIGGNAVAAWVSTVDPDAVRSTKDVDVLLRKAVETNNGDKVMYAVLGGAVHVGDRVVAERPESVSNIQQ